MKKLGLTLLSLLVAALGAGCSTAVGTAGGAASDGEGDAVEVGDPAPEEESTESAVQELKAPPDDPGCDASDEYYYETTTYTTQQSYLWHCVGYDSWNQYTECNTYQVCQVKKVWVNYGMCVDGLLYGYKYLKSTTTTNNCGNVSYSTTGGMCPNPLYGGYCY